MNKYNLTREQKRMRAFSLGDSLVRKIEEWMLSHHPQRGPSVRYLVLSEAHKAWGDILNVIQACGGDTEIIHQCRCRFSLSPSALPALSDTLYKAAWSLTSVMDQIEDMRETIDEVMTEVIVAIETVWNIEEEAGCE